MDFDLNEFDDIEDFQYVDEDESVDYSRDGYGDASGIDYDEY
jgi:hypothetical protein